MGRETASAHPTTVVAPGFLDRRASGQVDARLKPSMLHKRLDQGKHRIAVLRRSIMQKAVTSRPASK